MLSRAGVEEATTDTVWTVTLPFHSCEGHFEQHRRSIKRCTLSVCHSVCPSVPCHHLLENGVTENSNLAGWSPLLRKKWMSNFEIKRSKIKVTGENAKTDFRAYLRGNGSIYIKQDQNDRRIILHISSNNLISEMRIFYDVCLSVCLYVRPFIYSTLERLIKFILLWFQRKLFS